MNPECFICKQEARIVCQHPECNLSPFVCSGNCSFNTAFKFHTHNQSNMFLKIEKVKEAIMTLSSNTFETYVNNMRKIVDKVKHSLDCLLKTHEEKVNVSLKVTPEVQRIIDHIADKDKSQSLTGKDIFNLMKDKVSPYCYSQKIIRAMETANRALQHQIVEIERILSQEKIHEIEVMKTLTDLNEKFDQCKLQEDSQYVVQDKFNKSQKKKAQRKQRKNKGCEKSQEKRCPNKKVKLQHQKLQANQTQSHNEIPLWALPELCKDKNLNSSDSIKYDPSTLHIPLNEYTQMMDLQRQYWEFKSNHFDKILFIKGGRNFNLYYEDSIVGHQHLKLKRCKDSQMHVCFYQNYLQGNIFTLVEAGFKVAVIDQQQTKIQKDQRRKTEKGYAHHHGSGRGVVLRQIISIDTKGTTLLRSKDTPNSSNFLVSLHFKDNVFFFSLFSRLISKIFVGICKSADNFLQMLTIMQPVEVLFDPENLPAHLIKSMTKETFNMVESRLVNQNNKWSSKNCLQSLNRAANHQNLPLLLKESFGKDTQGIQITLSGLLAYLKRLQLPREVFENCKFILYSQRGVSQLRQKWNPQCKGSELTVSSKVCRKLPIAVEKKDLRQEEMKDDGLILKEVYE